MLSVVANVAARLRNAPNQLHSLQSPCFFLFFLEGALREVSGWHAYPERTSSEGPAIVNLPETGNFHRGTLRRRVNIICRLRIRRFQY